LERGRTLSGSQITQGADHTIHGVGQIEASLINYGTVRADGTLGQGTTLDLISGAKTNLGTFSAVNGGTLQVTSGLLTNTTPAPKHSLVVRTM
jgi:hypothetical protein